MKRLIFAVGILTLSTALIAETGPASSSSSLPTAPSAQTSTTTSTTTMTTTTNPLHFQPLFNMMVGGSYTLTNLTSVDGGTSTDVVGWFVAPTVQLTPLIAARFDLQQDYDFHLHYGELRLLRATAGPELSLPIPLVRRVVTPYVYAEGGATRISYPINPIDGHTPYLQWEATVDVGLGLQIPITRRIGFVFIPGEYSSFQLDNNRWQGNFSAKAGFVLNLYGNR
jgi:hypothetical protein